ncbi:hypothetical protein FOZ62_014259, partial [Perkinsus olseni]
WIDENLAVNPFTLVNSPGYVFASKEPKASTTEEESCSTQPEPRMATGLNSLNRAQTTATRVYLVGAVEDRVTVMPKSSTESGAMRIAIDPGVLFGQRRTEGNKVQCAPTRRKLEENRQGAPSLSVCPREAGDIGAG